MGTLPGGRSEAHQATESGRPRGGTILAGSPADARRQGPPMDGPKCGSKPARWGARGLNPSSCNGAPMGLVLCSHYRQPLTRDGYRVPATGARRLCRYEGREKPPRRAAHGRGKEDG